MKQRTFAGILWLYTGWYAGGMLAEFLGVSGAALGPMIGAAAAWLIAVDPRRIIWTAGNAAAVRTPDAMPEPA